MSKLLTGPRIKTLIATTIGSALYGIGLDAFIIPHNLLSGGLTGVAVMIYYLLHISPGIVNLVLNIPILYAAYRWLGGWAVVTAVYGTIAVSFFMDQFTYLTPMAVGTSDLVGSIIGGILIGIGSGIVYRYGGTTGGIDPIAQIARKYWGLQMGSVIFAINGVIIFISMFLFSIQAAVITLISIYITAMVTNKVVIGFQQQKSAFIVSYKATEISQQVIKTLGRGATLLNGTGAYTGEPKQVLFIVVNLTQITKLKALVESIDPNAFVLISDASEVIGQGFTTKTHPQALVEALTSSPTEEQRREALEGPKEIPSEKKGAKKFSKTVDHQWFHM